MEKEDGGEWKVCHGEVMLPDVLEKVGSYVFDGCPEIKTIWLGNNSIADSLRYGYSCTVVFSNKLMMVGDKFLRALRG